MRICRRIDYGAQANYMPFEFLGRQRVDGMDYPKLGMLPVAPKMEHESASYRETPLEQLANYSTNLGRDNME